jgi:hypothetical protein
MYKLLSGNVSRLIRFIMVILTPSLSFLKKTHRLIIVICGINVVRSQNHEIIENTVSFSFSDFKSGLYQFHKSHKFLHEKFKGGQ